MAAMLTVCESAAQSPIFDFQFSPPGNQPGGPWVLGNDFAVNSAIVISALGAFGNGGGALAAGIPVAIYNTATGRQIAGALLTTANAAYDAATQTRWLQISPVTLPPGKYSVVAANYGSTAGCEDNYNAAADPKGNPSPLVFESQDGALSMLGGRWLAQRGSLSSLPATLASWSGIDDGSAYPHPLFAAGTLAAAMTSAAPEILAQPASQTVVPGDKANFSVSAAGTPPLTYQWFFSGNPIPGATASSHALANAQAADAGAYAVVVANANGSLASSNATLAVLTALSPIFNFQFSPPGNQPGGPWVLGNDFAVNSAIVISALGAFDNGGDGLAAGIPVAIYNTATGQQITGAVLTTANAAYDAATQTRWLQISPATLPPGKYSVVAANYGSPAGCEDNYNAAADPKGNPSPLVFESQDGALSMLGGRWLAQSGSMSSLPAALASWSGIDDGSAYPHPLFAAGTLATAVVSTNSADLANEGGQYFVAPDGTGAGDGSYAKPWDLQTALNQPQALQAGHTVWLRGGTYQGAFTSALTGLPDNPIIVRQYPGERATLDCTNSSSAATLDIGGGWTWYWGFEIMNSSTNRSISRSSGVVSTYSASIKCINLVVHDAGIALCAWTPATNAEIYGCLIYNNGWQATPGDRRWGHAIYSQNFWDTKLIRDNILFNQMDYGIHIYTEGGSIQGFDLEGNVSFNNGVIAQGMSRCDNYLIGGYTPAARITLLDNFGYHTPGQGGRNIELGYQVNCDNSDVVAEGNYFGGGTLNCYQWTNVTMLDNTLVDCPFGLEPGLGAAIYNWNSNSYFFNAISSFSEASFASWQAQSGYDAQSVFTAGAPRTQVFIRPNLYETNRANIIVLNWELLDNVAVNISGVLAPGTPFEVRNAQDFFALPVVSGTYSGQAISLPMTNLTLAQAIGIATPPPTTGPQFNVFVLLSAQTAP
jgi:hypothetical protein